MKEVLIEVKIPLKECFNFCLNQKRYNILVLNSNYIIYKDSVYKSMFQNDNSYYLSISYDSCSDFVKMFVYQSYGSLKKIRCSDFMDLCMKRMLEFKLIDTYNNSWDFIPFSSTGYKLSVSIDLNFPSDSLAQEYLIHVENLINCMIEYYYNEDVKILNGEAITSMAENALTSIGRYIEQHLEHSI